MLSMLMGWPAVVASVIVLAGGLLRKRPALVALGAMLSLPFFLYVAGTPRFGVLAIIPVVLEFVAAWVLWRKRPLLAGTLCAPAVAFAVYIFVAVSPT